MAEKEQAAVCAIFADEAAALLDFQHARELVYSVAGEKEALEGLVTELREAFKASRSPEKRVALGLRAGVGLWILDRFDEAIEILEAVKEDATAAYFLGLCHLAREEYSQANKVLKSAAKKTEVAFPAAMALAEALRRSGDRAGAMAVLAEYEREYDGMAALHYEKGRCLEGEGDYEGAIVELERAVELNPQHAPALFHLAYICDLRGDDERAMELYKRCAALRPTYTNALVNLGVLYEDRGQYDEAIACYRRVLSVEPDHPRARLFLKDAIGSKTMYYDEEIEKRIERTSKILRIPITDFELSVRSRNCFEKMNIRTLGDLVQTTEEQLLSFKNFGETSLAEVKRILISKGLRLGMNVVQTPKGPALMEPESLMPPEQEEALLEPIEHLELSIRARKCMEELGIRTVGDLVQKSAQELLACKNFGETSLKEVQEKLAELGLRLAEPPAQ